MKYAISAPMEHFLDRPASDPAEVTRLPRTPYEIAWQITSELGNGLGSRDELYPHPSGLSMKIRVTLHDVARGKVWRDRFGYVAPEFNFADPWILALKRANLVRLGMPDDDGCFAVVLTEHGQAVVDGKFVAKVPDLLDLLAGAA